MDDLVLYIFSEQRNDELQYTFVLEEHGRPPVIGIRTLRSTQPLDHVLRAYDGIGDAVKIYLRKLASFPEWSEEEIAATDNAYKNAVTEEVNAVSIILREHFWPDTSQLENEPFIARYNRLECASAQSPDPAHLLLATNESKIPWWITGGTTPNDGRLICELFALGMISLRTNQVQPAQTNPPVEVRVITCPSHDLATNTKIPEVKLGDEVQPDLRGVARYALLSGRGRTPPGLDKQQVKVGFKEGRIVLYHGHFNLNTNTSDLSQSSILVSGTPIVRRNQDQTNIYRLDEHITLGSLASEQALDNKDIIFIACGTAGMHPGIELTLAEYLAKRGSTLVGTLYPVLDPQARSFANNLAKALFRDHYSWGESVRRAREAAKFDDSLFYRAAYCYFGIPWQMSPLFSARKHLSILVPAYLRQVYELVKPSKVYSSLIDLEFVPPAQLKGAVDRLDEAAATDDGFLFIAALPSVHVAELLKNKDWVVLGPMVASQGDVRFIATDPIEDFRQATVWHHQDIVIKGRDLTASAFLEVLLHKWGIRISESQWKTIPTDCAPVIREGLAKFGLMVAREDLPINESGTSTTEPFIGHSLFEVDTELAKFYDGEPIPRILWVTKRACTTGWRRFYIVEFFKRLSERISDENRNSDLAVLGSTIPSKVRLYRVGDKDDYKIEINQAKRTLSKFLRDWAELDPDPQKPRQKIADGNWYDWSATEDKQQE